MTNRSRTARSADRATLLEESLKAIFVGKKIHLFSNHMSIKGTCVDVSHGDFCMSDATYKVASSLPSEISVTGKSSYMMVSKSGKNIAILD